jgi:hypothetical protein
VINNLFIESIKKKISKEELENSGESNFEFTREGEWTVTSVQTGPL